MAIGLQMPLQGVHTAQNRSNKYFQTRLASSMYGNLSGLFGISRFLFAVCLYFIYLHKYVQFVVLGLVRGLVHILVYLSFEYYFKLLFVNAFE